MYEEIISEVNLEDAPGYDEDILFLDTETTGIQFAEDDDDPERKIDEVIALAILGMDEEEGTQKFFMPSVEIHEEAYGVHGISIEDLKYVKARSFSRADGESLLEKVKGKKIVAHNASFDVKMINHMLSKVDLEPIQTHAKIIDSLAISRSLGGKRNTLDSLIKKYGVDVGDTRNNHDALTDCILLRAVWIPLSSEYYNVHKNKSFVTGFGDDKSVQEYKEVAVKRLTTKRELKIVSISSTEEKRHNKALAENEITPF
jgi:DNA polymerase-3 subunit epsilon